MICSHCQRENPPHNAFCHACGTPMGAAFGAGASAPAAAPAPAPAPSRAVASRCARCGTDNPAAVQYCRTCGSDLSLAQGGRAAAAPAAASAPLDFAAVPPLAPPAPAFGGSVAPAAAGSGAEALCRRCGGQLDPAARFCKFCGTPHEASAAGGAAAPVSPPSIHPAPAAQAAQAARGAQATRGQVVIIQRDGSEGGVFSLDLPQTDLGSREGDIVLPDDPYLSPRHARIERRGESYVLRDLGSSNGVYVRLREPVDLAPGDMFLIGQQVLRFEVLPEHERRVGPAKQHGVMVFGTPELPRLARLVQYTTEGLERDVYYLYRDETVLGREQADIVFAEDPFLSRRHAAITMDRDAMRFVLRDLGSSNGTALRTRVERTLSPGDQFRLGRHLFRFDLVPGDARGGRGHG